MTASHAPSLPAHLAFVIQLRADSGREPGELRGRVEHVVTGECRHFESLAELLEFLGAVVERG